MRFRKTVTAAALAYGVVAGGVAIAAPASAHAVSCAAYDYVVWSHGIPYCFATATGTTSRDYINKYVDSLTIDRPVTVIVQLGNGTQELLGEGDYALGGAYVTYATEVNQ